MRILVSPLTLSLLLHASPVQAADARPPGVKPPLRALYYPSQIPYGPPEDGRGNTGMALAPGAFSRFLHGTALHHVAFDHCYPDYGINGKTCR
jgi:hypothetical protein